MPGIEYEQTSGNLVLTGPLVLYAMGAPNMSVAKIREIQEALARQGFDPGPIDGIFGSNTTAAVAAFQRTKGLVMDGQVGTHTAAALGVSLT